MSASLLVYLFGMACVFAGERLLEAYSARWAVDLVGVVALVLALYLRANARSKSDGAIRAAHGRLWVFTMIGVASLVIYGLSTREFSSLLGLSELAEGHDHSVGRARTSGGQLIYDALLVRGVGVMGVLWPIMLLGATLPLITLDRAVDASPKMIPHRRVQQATLNGLIAALGLALVFPVNFVASRHAKIWDYSYFKTSQAGTSTQAIVNGLKAPISVTIFQPASSDVTQELRRYFEQLEGPNLKVAVVDQAADPRLAQALKVRNNGMIAFSTEGGEDKKVQFVEVGTELKRARASLKKLDQEVHRALLVMARGELKAYVTTGHGELTWERSEPEHRRITGFKQVLEYSGYQVAKLGVDNGLGEDVPEDAALVAIIGAERPFHPSEVAALVRYVERGGAIFVALEPLRPDTTEQGAMIEDLLKALGIKQEAGVLASDQQIVQVTGGILDRMNITTGSFSTHASTAVLATQPSGMLFSRASGLTALPNSRGNPVPTVRTTAQTWVDLNMNLEFDQGEESRSARPLAMAASGGTPSFRGIVTGDATMFSDFAIVARGNHQFIMDGLNWLSRTESYSGTTESEEDIRIQHTREGQAGWFYMTVLGFPLIILMVGFIRVRRRGGKS